MPDSASDRTFARTEQWAVDRVYRTLDATDRLLDHLGVRYTVIGGTLLGAVRHRGLIPWDDDGDIGVRQEDIAGLAGASDFLRPLGCDIRYDGWGSYKVFALDGRRISPQHEYRYPFTDIFALRETEAGELVYAEHAAYRMWPQHRFAAREFGRLARHEFGPLRLSGIPTPAALRYLDRCYGPNWRTEAYLTFDHLADERRENRVVRLETMDCSRPSVSFDARPR